MIIDLHENEQQYIASLPDRCRGCGKNGCDDYVAPYWKYHIHTKQGPCKPKHRVHKSCKQKVISKTAYECQKIDADCNDCRHFQRGEYLGNDVWQGMCKKYGRSTKAYPNYCSNHPCFEHRKDSA